MGFPAANQLPLSYNEPLPTIHGRFESVVSAGPERIAVTDESLSFDYKTLNRISNALAKNLTDIYGAENIAIFHENTVWQVVSILGILKAGKTYVPLDTTFPPDRNRAIMQEAGTRLILTETGLTAKHQHFLNGFEVVCSDQFIDKHDVDAPEVAVCPGDRAILLFTSGSTGKPKGVIQTHENMVHFIGRLTSFCDIKPDFRFAHYLSTGFSAHALPLLAALLNGGHLMLFNVKKDGITAFTDWFTAQKINAALVLPSFLRHWLDVIEKGTTFPDLKLLLFGGETLYRGDVEKARKVFAPHNRMINILASTEAYLSRAFIINHDTPLVGNIVPVGYPVEGVDLFLRDEEGNDCAPGETGEIYLRSKYVSPGYWNNPVQTNADVVRDIWDNNLKTLRTYDKGVMRADGCVVHLGRKDHMVKIRGFRIDLAEIESVLLTEPEVKEAVCAVKQNYLGVEHLIAWIVPATGHMPDLSFLKAKAAKVLPDYMVPSRIMQISELPKNASGKTDRTLIPEPEWNTADVAGQKELPIDDTEKKLLMLFEKSLQISPVGVTDNFLELGADSLRLFVAFNSIEKEFGRRIPVDVLLQHPTIRQIAGLILKPMTDEH